MATIIEVMSETPDIQPDNTPPPVPDHLEFKAVLLLGFMFTLIVAAALYVMYARGLFESSQRLVLVSEDSEGVVVGMNMTFSGFPIGRVRRIELADDGKARIVVDVASKDAKWLRKSSVFTVVRGLVGGTNIRAYTGVLTDPPLEDGAVRTVLQGDAGAEVPKLIAAAKDLLESVSSLVSSQGALGASFGNIQTLTAKINGPGGALSVVLGSVWASPVRSAVPVFESCSALKAVTETGTSCSDSSRRRAVTVIFSTFSLSSTFAVPTLLVGACWADTDPAPTNMAAMATLMYFSFMSLSSFGFLVVLFAELFLRNLVR